MNVYIITARPVGWGSLSLGRSVAVVANSVAEAEGQAKVKLGLENKRVVPQEVASPIMGTTAAERKGYGDALYLSTWKVDFHTSNASVGGVTLAELISAYDSMKELST